MRTINYWIATILILLGAGLAMLADLLIDAGEWLQDAGRKLDNLG